ncbi:MAG TPA: rhomboid family intramembrane serine protease [Acidimicrobiia bacterium]|nr:rhomboid family intramembrane serine protease [Acidimicrobiia bacterium]
MVIPLRDDNPTTRAPVLTIILIVANLAIFAFVQPHGSDSGARFDYEHAAIPCEIVHGRPLSSAQVASQTCNPGPFASARYSSAPLFGTKNVYLAVLFSMFLHGSWLHVLGNMLFLWVFGNNVEDRFGHVGYALFYFAAGLAAAAAHIAANSTSTAPFLGASGAIAGVMGAYLVLWPRARVLTWIAALLIVVVYLPAWLVLGAWFGFQFFTDPNTGVAWVAHVGGFAFGMVVGFALRDVLRPRPRPPWS